MSVAGRSTSAGLGSISMSVSALKGSAMAWPRLGARHFLITLYAISLLFRHTRHTHTPLHGVWLVVEQLIGLIDGTTYVSVSECKC